jgi:hypothetical protein
MTVTEAARELPRWRVLFVVAAAYDIALGLAFLVLWEPIFEWLGMAAPPHVSYVHLLAVFVAIQGISYALVAVDPLENLGIVKVGVIYKGGYSALAAWYLVTDQIPAMFFAWFGLFDFLFLIAFALFLRRAAAWRRGS